MKIEPGEVHIWSAAINENYYKLLNDSYLSENEKKRTEQFSNDIDAFLFAVRHNLLRLILSGYLKCNPSEIRFGANPFNKPFIAFPKTPLQFNISVTSNRFIATLSMRHPIGIDLELIIQIKDIDQLIADYFTKNESDWIYNHSGDETIPAFFSLWTKKEALVKAIGQGLSIPLNKFEVLSVNPVAFGSNEWYIKPLNIYDDCSAAIAINSPTGKLSYFDALTLLNG